MDTSKFEKSIITNFVKVTVRFLLFCIAILLILFSCSLLGQQEELNEYGDRPIILENPEKDKVDASDTLALYDQDTLKLIEVAPLPPCE